MINVLTVGWQFPAYYSHYLLPQLTRIKGIRPHYRRLFLLWSDFFTYLQCTWLVISKIKSFNFRPAGCYRYRYAFFGECFSYTFLHITFCLQWGGTGPSKLLWGIGIISSRISKCPGKVWSTKLLKATGYIFFSWDCLDWNKSHI